MARLIALSLALFLLCFAQLGTAGEDKQALVNLLAKMRSANTRINSFTAEMQLERFLPDYALQKQLVWFKRPGFIKLKQLGPYKKGAELLIKPDGTIRGHLGGLLRFFVVSLAADDENLYGVTHDSAFTTEFDAILDIADSLVPKVTRYTITEKVQDSRRFIILDTFYAADINRIRLQVDAETLMISRLERYRNDRLLHRIVWKKLVLNPALDDSVFTF